MNIKRIASVFLILLLVVAFISPVSSVYADNDDKGSGLGKNINDLDVKIEGGKVSGGFASDEINGESVWNGLFNKFKGVILGVNGLAMLGSVLFLIRNIVKVQAASDKPQELQQAKKSLFVTLFATALLGVALGVVGYFWHILA